MKVVCLAITLLSCILSYGQVDSLPAAPKALVFSFVEQMPQFPGGEKELMKFLQQNIHYPQSAIDKNISGKVVTRFVVNEDGSVSDEQVLRHVDTAMDAEAIRVLKLLPKFLPGKQQGKAVKVYYNLPMVFKLAAPDTAKKEVVEEKAKRDPYYDGALALVKKDQYLDAEHLSILSILLFPKDYLGYEILGDCDVKLDWNDDAFKSYSKAKELGSPNTHASFKELTDSVRSALKSNDSDRVYTFVSQPPQFPGGDDALMKFIAQNIKYPTYEKDHNISGSVLLRCVIDIDGSVKNVVVGRGVTAGLDDEAVRVVKLLPKFKPGYQNGMPVRVYFNLPVRFKNGSSESFDVNSLMAQIQRDSYYRNAYALTQQGRIKDALDLLALAALKNPGEYLYYELMALCEANLGKKKETCDDYFKAKELGSPYASFFLNKICK